MPAKTEPPESDAWSLRYAGGRAQHVVALYGLARTYPSQGSEPGCGLPSVRGDTLSCAYPACSELAWNSYPEHLTPFGRADDV